MKYQIAPSILSFDPANVLGPVENLVQSGLEVLHLDVMDGQFVPPITFGSDLAKSLSRFPVLLEAHLMTNTPERHFESFVAAGCKRIIFHVEVAPHAHRHLQALKAMGIQAGIALNPSTPLSAVEEVLSIADLVLCMTVNPGWGGQKIIPEVFDKVRRIRAKFPEINIEVDGGIDPTTIGAAKAAGANLFVAGSYLTRAGYPGQGFQELSALCA